jgi:hypothetical protein
MLLVAVEQVAVALTHYAVRKRDHGIQLPIRPLRRLHAGGQGFKLRAGHRLISFGAQYAMVCRLAWPVASVPFCCTTIVRSAA